MVETRIKVKLLHPDARVPSVTYAGSDIGFDLYAIEDVILAPGVPVKVRTGIAVEGPPGCGFLLGDRSSMAARGVTYAGGRIDAGYRGEILVCLINVNQPRCTLRTEVREDGALIGAMLDWEDVRVHLSKGDKIAQMSPFHALTHFKMEAVSELMMSERAEKGFGSSGR